MFIHGSARPSESALIRANGSGKNKPIRRRCLRDADAGRRRNHKWGASLNPFRLLRFSAWMNSIPITPSLERNGRGGEWGFQGQGSNATKRWALVRFAARCPTKAHVHAQAGPASARRVRLAQIMVRSSQRAANGTKPDQSPATSPRREAVEAPGAVSGEGTGFLRQHDSVYFLRFGVVQRTPVGA